MTEKYDNAKGDGVTEEDINLARILLEIRLDWSHPGYGTTSKLKDAGYVKTTQITDKAKRHIMWTFEKLAENKIKEIYKNG